MVPGWRARLVSVMLACALPLGNGATAATPMPPSAATMATTITTAKDDPAVTGRFRTLWLKLRGEDGFLGKPLADRRCNETRSRCMQRFAGGTITWRKGDPVTVRATSQTSSVLVVVNKRRPVSPRSYAPERLRTVKGSNQRMRPGAARALEKLLKAAAADGSPLGVRSGYRSFATQRSVYARWVRTYGKARAERISARAGYSEHQTGLAVDVLASSGAGRTFASFGRTRQARWVARNAHRYGFIVRYQKGQEKITGYAAEPWHLRYVGPALAKDMKKVGSRSLEEHFGLRAAPRYP